MGNCSRCVLVVSRHPPLICNMHNRNTNCCPRRCHSNVLWQAALQKAGDTNAVASPASTVSGLAAVPRGTAIADEHWQPATGGFNVYVAHAEVPSALHTDPAALAGTPPGNPRPRSAPPWATSNKTQSVLACSLTSSFLQVSPRLALQPGFP